MSEARNHFWFGFAALACASRPRCASVFAVPGHDSPPPHDLPEPEYEPLVGLCESECLPPCSDDVGFSCIERLSFAAFCDMVLREIKGDNKKFNEKLKQKQASASVNIYTLSVNFGNIGQ